MRSVLGDYEGRRFLKLHLRCEGCQADVFRPMECGPPTIVAGRDISLERAVGELIFVCQNCPSERARLVAHTPLWRERSGSGPELRA